MVPIYFDAQHVKINTLSIKHIITIVMRCVCVCVFGSGRWTGKASSAPYQINGIRIKHAPLISRAIQLILN